MIRKHAQMAGCAAGLVKRTKRSLEVSTPEMGLPAAYSKKSAATVRCVDIRVTPPREADRAPYDKGSATKNVNKGEGLLTNLQLSPKNG